MPSKRKRALLATQFGLNNLVTGGDSLPRTVLVLRQCESEPHITHFSFKQGLGVEVGAYSPLILLGIFNKSLYLMEMFGLIGLT